MFEKNRTVNTTKHKKKSFFKSIRFKFIFWFLVISLVPLLIVGIVAYFYGGNIVTKKIFDHLVAINDSRKEHIKTFINAKKGRIIDFSSDGFIRDTSKEIVKGYYVDSNHDIDIKKSIKKLNYHLANNKKVLDDDILEIMVINHKGIVISSTNEGSIGIRTPYPGNLQESSNLTSFWRENTVYVSPVYYSEVLGRSLLSVSAPITDKNNGELLGIIVHRNGTDALKKITSNRVGLGETGETLLWQRDGDNISLLFPMRHSSNATTSVSIPLDSGEAEPMRLALEGKSGAIIAPDYRNVTVVAAYEYIPNMRWGLVTKMDKVEAFAPLRKIRNLIFIVMIPVFSTIIVISFFISRKISKPIISINDAIKKITSGEFEYNISVSTDDELEQISVELNKISSVIDESYKKLLHSERLASVGRITAGVAHEVNNPLSVLSGRLQLLIEKCKDNNLSDEYKKLLGLTNRIENTVDGLLYFSRQKDMNLTSEDINNVMEDSISLVEEQMQARGIEIFKKYGSNIPTINISSDQIQQAFFNIILNAYDSMTNKGILKICTKLSDDGKGIQINIEDTGSGISDKDISNIFEPFYTTKPPHKGTGLGLSISYGIIKNHNGSVKVESKEGEGTTFIINLPVIGQKWGQTSTFNNYIQIAWFLI